MGFPWLPRYLTMAAATIRARPWTGNAVSAAALGSLAFPIGIFAWLLAHPAADPSIVVPRQHFIIVTAVSLLAFGLAISLAIAASRSPNTESSSCVSDSWRWVASSQCMA